MPKILKIVFLCSFATAGLAAAAMAGEEPPKWFVVRQHTTGGCQAQRIIEVNGEYVHAFAQLAGGPYDTKQQALDREAYLATTGTCTSTS